MLVDTGDVSPSVAGILPIPHHHANSNRWVNVVVACW